MMSGSRDEDLKVIGRLYVNAVAAERGADVDELVKSMGSIVRAVDVDGTREANRRLNDALTDALRTRQMRHYDSPELLIRDLLAYVRITVTSEDTEHFFERARKLGFEV